MQRNTKWLLVFLAMVPIGCALLLVRIFGPLSIGLRCERSAAERRCQVLRSGLFGLADNSVVVIPESEIAGAITERPRAGVGRGGGGYTVALELKHGPYRYYPVLSGQFFASTDRATSRLNRYLADPTARSIELHEDVAASVLMPFAPLALVLALVGVGLYLRHRRGP